jgi:hypothetical protein
MKQHLSRIRHLSVERPLGANASETHKTPRHTQRADAYFPEHAGLA